MSNLEKFDHLVVVMFENRSLDNLFGYLYENDQPKKVLPEGSDLQFDGVADKPLSNPYAVGDSVGVAPVSRAAWQTALDMIQPFPDPGETYPNIFRQQYNQVFDCKNPQPLPDSGDMSGFVNDYADVVQSTEGWNDVPDIDTFDFTKIMHCFPPEAVPVLSGIAKQFAISDEWFCSVPSQTFTNRSFANSGQSHGFVNNSDYVKWLENDAPTIFNRLSDAGKQWQVLWDKQDIVGSFTRILHPTLFSHEFDDNFVEYEEENLGEVLQGDLPEYTFIEPRLIFNHNDMHPSVSLNPDVASSINAGEELLNTIYNGIKNNPNRDRILLMIMFDEAGGTYDHVWPNHKATPPLVNPSYELECGFDFSRFGIRVPALFISSYVEEGTVIRSPLSDTPFDHTSLIKTICNRWGLPSLTDRDAAAADVSSVLSRETPREEWPEFEARSLPVIKEPILNHSIKSGLQREIINLIVGILKKDVSKIHDFHDFVTFSEKEVRKLMRAFGRK